MRLVLLQQVRLKVGDYLLVAGIHLSQPQVFGVIQRIFSQLLVLAEFQT